MVDSHVHIGYSEKCDKSYSLDQYGKWLESNGMDSAVVFPNVTDYQTAFQVNESLLNECFLYKGNIKFYPFLIINTFEKEMLPQVCQKGVYGLKIHPSILRCFADNTNFEEFYSLKLPVTVHCGRDSFSRIDYLILAAKQFPDTNFIAAHLGGNTTDLIIRALTLLEKEKLPNLYLDTSNGKSPRLIKKAIDILGIDKILFGSDEPYADLTVQKFCIECLNLNESDTNKIMGDNIRRLLNG